MVRGSGNVVWDGRTDRRQSASAGVYFYRFEAGGFSETKRMALVKYGHMSSRFGVGRSVDLASFIFSVHVSSLQSHPGTRDFGPGKFSERLERLMNG